MPFSCGLMLAALLLSPPATEPIVVPARFVSGAWFLEGTVSGEATSFMVDSGANRTVVLPGKGRLPGYASVQIGVGKLNMRVEASVEDVNIVQWVTKAAGNGKPGALLGADLLGRAAVGFDYDRAEITFWPGGRLDRKAALKWAMEGAGPGAKEARVGLDKRYDTSAGLTASYDKWRGGLLLDTGSTLSTLQSRHTPKVEAIGVSIVQTVLDYQDVIEAILLTPKAKIGTVEIPWFRFRMSEMASDFPGKPSGAFSINDLRSHRVIVDFPGAALYFAEPGREQSLGVAFSEVTNVPCVFEGGKIRLGKQIFDALKAGEGAEVISIAGRAAPEILDALDGKKPGGLKFIFGLLGDLHKDFSVWVETKDGKKRLDVNVLRREK